MRIDGECSEITSCFAQVPAPPPKENIWEKRKTVVPGPQSPPTGGPQADKGTTPPHPGSAERPSDKGSSPREEQSEVRAETRYGNPFFWNSLVCGGIK